MLKFDEGCALVIGGSGGLGSVICRRLAVAGSNILASYRSNADGAERVCAEARAEGVRAETAQLDLVDSEAIADLIQRAESDFGAVHTVVYAAGPHIRLAPIADIGADEFQDALSADVGGFFNLVASSLPALRRSRGSYVALTTGALRRYAPLDILSIAPKAAVEQIVRGIAREEGRNGVRANAIGVGWVDVGLAVKALSSDRARRLRDKIIAGTPLRRAAQPEEVADLVVFLASLSAGYISGEYISVTGGGSV